MAAMSSATLVKLPRRMALSVSSRNQPALHQIQPRRRRRDEVQVEPGVLGKPGHNIFVAVGAVVVDDEVDAETLGHLLVDAAQEAQELVVAVPWQAAAEHLAGGDVEGGEQGRARPYTCRCTVCSTFRGTRSGSRREN